VKEVLQVYLLQRKEMYGMPHPVNDEIYEKKHIVKHGNTLSEGFSVRP